MSLDGKRVAFEEPGSNGRTLVFWEPASNTTRRLQVNASADVYNLAPTKFSRDGTRLLVGEGTRHASDLAIVEMSTGKHSYVARNVMLWGDMTPGEMVFSQNTTSHDLHYIDEDLVAHETVGRYIPLPEDWRAQNGTGAILAVTRTTGTVQVDPDHPPRPLVLDGSCPERTAAGFPSQMGFLGARILLLADPCVEGRRGRQLLLLEPETTNLPPSSEAVPFNPAGPTQSAAGPPLFALAAVIAMACLVWRGLSSRRPS